MITSLAKHRSDYLSMFFFQNRNRVWRKRSFTRRDNRTTSRTCRNKVMVCMKMSWHGNAFHITGRLWGQSTSLVSNNPHFCCKSTYVIGFQLPPDSKVHGANKGPTWVLSAPDGPHDGPVNLAIWVPFPTMSLLSVTTINGRANQYFTGHHGGVMVCTRLTGLWCYKTAG